MIEQLIGTRGRDDDNLIGTVEVGSVGRKDNDDYSDIDVVFIYQERPSAPVLPEGVSLQEGKLIGARNIPYAFLKARTWSQVEKHAYTNSRLVFDREGVVRDLISEKAVWQQGERLRLFCDNLVKLSYIVNVTDNFKNCWNGCDELMSATARGNMQYASRLVHRFTRSFLNLGLLTDGLFLPPDKVVFSDWSRCAGKNTAVAYAKVSAHAPLPQDSHAINGIFHKETLGLVQEFDVCYGLPDDIYQYRIQEMRRYE